MKSILLFLSLLPVAYGIVCRSDYTMINGRLCLKYYPIVVPHSAAEQRCKLDGGTLFTVQNSIDNRAITEWISATNAQQVWMGLSVFGDSPLLTYWDDNSGVAVYNNFHPPYPNEKFNSHCAALLVNANQGSTRGQWISSTCNNQNNTSSLQRPYICQVPPTYSYSPCDINYNGYCYWRSKVLVNGTKLNQAQAAAACSQRGAQLVSIHSKMENDFIKLQYRGTTIQNIFIGAVRQSALTYKWADGTYWDFTYIHPFSNHSKLCLMMSVNDGSVGLWNGVDCSEELDFLCKQKISPTVAVPEQLKSFAKSPPAILDFSSCNSTLILRYPNMFSSNPYNSIPTTYCSWRLLALGPYQIGIYFNSWITNGVLDIYDEFDNNIGHFAGTAQREPFFVITPFNIARVTFTPASHVTEDDRGFVASVLPV
ncbi:hypothetical protein L5515_006683 [Caenorhabditis briggsae]|uniref:C-type lectin domain-containing protein n=1 Tax=Caenorhabditis briggsae TaxID=6238 RepID=A0AAE9JL70_CAEBR|nr:hypothetical protein L5515_006683 [Caenorhabditis briggsae]